MRNYCRLPFWALMLVGMASIGIIYPTASAAPGTYDPNPWLEDLGETRVALATKYANLDWVVLEHETNLTALFNQAQEHIKSASPGRALHL